MMSSVGLRSEVRFSDSGMSRRMDAVTFGVAGGSGRATSVSSRHNRSDGSDDVFEPLSPVLLPGLREWMDWRVRLNSAMIDLVGKRHRMFDFPEALHPKHTNMAEPDFLISRQVSESALCRAVHDHVTGKDGLRLQAPTFITFGLPRVKLRTNTSYIPETGSTHDTASGSISPTIDYSVAKVDLVAEPEVVSTRPAPPMDKTVVIVSYTEVGGPRKSHNHNDVETDSLCAVLDLSDDPDDVF